MAEKINPLAVAEMEKEQGQEPKSEVSFIVTRREDGSVSVTPIDEKVSIDMGKVSAIIIELAEHIRQQTLANMVSELVLRKLEAYSKGNTIIKQSGGRIVRPD